jgi:hypothetical protein
MDWAEEVYFLKLTWQQHPKGDIELAYYAMRDYVRIILRG